MTEQHGFDTALAPNPPRLSRGAPKSRPRRLLVLLKARASQPNRGKQIRKNTPAFTFVIRKLQRSHPKKERPTANKATLQLGTGSDGDLDGTKSTAAA